MRKSSPVLVALLLISCAATQIHPGSPNAFDSATYDTLVATHSVIESTKTDLAANSFPASISANVKTALNALIQAYDVADTAYQAYHSSALAGTATTAQQAAVSSAITQVNTSTTNLTNAKAAKP